MSTNCIEVNNISKSFKKTKALDNVSLTIKKGELFGLLGPNGAGKTTLVNILSGLLLPDSGMVKINGINVAENPDDVQARIGYLSGYSNFCNILTGAENLTFYAEASGKSWNKCLARTFGLEGRINDKAGEYSMGMLQRLGLMHTLIGNKKILLLDEPTIGLDPMITRTVRQFILKLNRKDTTILLTTHNMVEAEQLCNRMAFINKGRIVAVGTSEQLKKLVRKKHPTLEDVFIHLTRGRFE